MAHAQQPINVTPAALERVKALLAQRGKPSAGVRIGIRARGCSGMSYTLEYADEKSPFDEVVEIRRRDDPDRPEGDDVHPRHRDGLRRGQAESGFVFRNPNEKGRCGCGESFHV